jgi:hypothetical protein
LPDTFWKLFGETLIEESMYVFELSKHCCDDV